MKTRLTPVTASSHYNQSKSGLESGGVGTEPTLSGQNSRTEWVLGAGSTEMKG